jgi:hypothetical protein
MNREPPITVATYRDAVRDLGELRADNARLRALLREGNEVTMQYGDDGSIAYWRARVRAALERKP